METAYNLVPGLIFGAIAVLIKFPKKFSSITATELVFLSVYFCAGVMIGLFTVPVIQWARQFTVEFVSSSPDFIIKKAQTIIIGILALVGFLIGLRLGKRKA